MLCMAERIPNFVARKQMIQSQFAGMTGVQTAAILYDKAVRLVCEPDKHLVLANWQMVPAMPAEERNVSFAGMQFLSKYLSCMMLMFAFRYREFWAACGDALEAEMMLDSLSAEERSMLRETMTDHRFQNDTLMCIGQTCFSDEQIAYLIRIASYGFQKLSPDVQDAARRMTLQMSDDDRNIVTVLLSYPVYWLRIFSRNMLFLDQVEEMAVLFCRKNAVLFGKDVSKWPF